MVYLKSKYKKLFIIGNGFDRWQGMSTSYDEFKSYYKQNIRDVTRKLHIKTKTNKKGELITPVEMVYGNSFNPTTLPTEFFWNFELSTALLDDQNINKYFGKSKRGLQHLQETVDQAQKILQKIFCDWINSVEITAGNAGYHFDDSCYFINFNYTDTLIKRFGVNPENEYHIHGEANDPESIIFGHSTHPETAFSELINQKFIRKLDGKKSERLQGLYFIENTLYETDKHVQDNIDDLCEVMTLNGIHIEDFTDIYVLGHSFSEPDFEYFDFLVKATQKDCNFNTLSALWKVQQIGLKLIDEESILHQIMLNIQYATQHRKRAIGKDNLSFPKLEMLEMLLFGQTGVYTDGDGTVHKIEEADIDAKKAVYNRFLIEQAERTKKCIEELCILKGVYELPDDVFSVLKAADYIDGGHDKRSADAEWHISYYSKDDKKRIEQVMLETGCNKFELHKSIEECIATYKE